ncbi:MAG: symmetrical bis(5'-nucleosyl)-tetraphosphatase [Magnetococcales bacterium]|nr:symmetrical bis(5'-nucleosyl)-tetraphosphatase [Magnetococcales bacterium]
MATYAIGDIHGCFDELQNLLTKLAFNPKHDNLWFVGDLISRGPNSLGCLRFIRDLGDSAKVVLGNHELRAIVGLSGNGTKEFNSFMGFFNNIPDREELYSWICSLPLVHHDKKLGFTMVHAGLAPNCSLADALNYSEMFSNILADKKLTKEFFAKSNKKKAYQQPDPNNQRDCLYYNVELMTKIRYCNKDGKLLSPKEVRESKLLGENGEPHKGSPYQAWHKHRIWQADEKIVYGHWAVAGLTIGSHHFGLDSGAVYGGKLTAMQLDHPQHPITQVDSHPYIVIPSNA